MTAWLDPVRDSVPVPRLVSPPVPLMTPPKVAVVPLPTVRRAEPRVTARQALIDDGPEGQRDAEEVHPARERLEIEPERRGRPDFAPGQQWGV